MSLHFAWFYFCILTAGLIQGAETPKLFLILCGERFLSVVSHHSITLDFFYKTGDGTKQSWGDDEG